MGLRDRFSRKKDASSGLEDPGADAATGPEPAADDMPTLVSGAPVPGPGMPDDQTFIAAPLEPADAGADGAVAEAGHPAGAQAGGPDAPAPVEPQAAAAPAAPARPGFRERGRLRRRLRYLREVRELGYRDLGGLVLDQHRFQRPNEELVAGKVAAIEALDNEMRAIEQALSQSTPYTELFIPGLSACPRCGALHGSDARFCPQCGLSFRGPRTVAGVGTPEASAFPPPAGTPEAAFPQHGPGQSPAPYPPAPQPVEYPPAPQPPAAPEPAAPEAAQETEVRPPTPPAAS